MYYFRGNLTENPITVAELVNGNGEVPFPTMELNTPPNGLTFNASSGATLGSNISAHLINVQALIVDAKERLWLLDTGHPVLSTCDNALSAFGGPRLMGFNLSSNATEPFTTITFPEDVLSPSGYLNDFRFDLRSPNLTEAGQGVAYILVVENGT